MNIVHFIPGKIAFRSLALGVAAMAGGCGEPQEHPLAREGISPYEKAQESMDAYKAEMEKKYDSSGRPR